MLLHLENWTFYPGVLTLFSENFNFISKFWPSVSQFRLFIWNFWPFSLSNFDFWCNNFCFILTFCLFLSKICLILNFLPFFTNKIYFYLKKKKTFILKFWLLIPNFFTSMAIPPKISESQVLLLYIYSNETWLYIYTFFFTGINGLPYSLVSQYRSVPITSLWTMLITARATTCHFVVLQ